MGVHIHILEADGATRVQGWDWIRQGGDRLVFDVLSSIPYQSLPLAPKQPRTTPGWWEEEDETGFRPESVEDFLRKLKARIPCNPDRWDQMCALLAEDPGRTLYFSW